MVFNSTRSITPNIFSGTLGPYIPNLPPEVAPSSQRQIENTSRELSFYPTNPSASIGETPQPQIHSQQYDIPRNPKQFKKYIEEFNKYVKSNYLDDLERAIILFYESPQNEVKARYKTLDSFMNHWNKTFYPSTNSKARFKINDNNVAYNNVINEAIDELKARFDI
jgi:hypothetical protein